MTDFEYEYEWLQDQAYKAIQTDVINKQRIDTGDGTMERTFSMDEDEYEHIMALSEQDEFVDFEIPKDAPLGKRASESMLGIEEAKETPVDLDKLFGGGTHG